MTWATDPEGALVGHGMARARREFCTESLRQRGGGLKEMRAEYTWFWVFIVSSLGTGARKGTVRGQ